MRVRGDTVLSGNLDASPSLLGGLGRRLSHQADSETPKVPSFPPSSPGCLPIHDHSSWATLEPTWPLCPTLPSALLSGGAGRSVKRGHALKLREGGRRAGRMIGRWNTGNAEWAPVPADRVWGTAGLGDAGEGRYQGNQGLAATGLTWRLQRG